MQAGRRAVLAAAVAGCAGREPRPVPNPEPDGVPTAWLVALGWHTEVVFAWPDDEAPVVRGLVGASFGARDYFTAAEPGVTETLAALASGPAVILLAPRAGPGVDAVPFARPDAPRLLARFVAAELARGGDGRPVVVAPGFSPGAVFLAAKRPYSLRYTCNSWTLDALGAAGVPVSGQGVVTAGGAMAAARAAT